MTPSAAYRQLKAILTENDLPDLRFHDLRHTFAVDRLTAWYKENQDVQKLLPVLSTYLGHTHLSHTSVYLTMTDGLLREASKRFESYIKQKNDE